MIIINKKGFDDMNNYPINKYRFYFAGNKIIAVSTYAGKQVRGVAICHPDDNFSIETGKKIAAARCNYKISAKRYARAQAKVSDAEQQVEKAKQHLANMRDYMNNSYVAMNEAAQEHDRMIAELC